MKILHIYKDFYPPTCGGVEIAIHRIIEATRDQCDEISVLICNRKHKSEFAEVEGTPVYKVGEWGRFLSAPMSPYFPYWLNKLDVDILHYHLPNPTAVVSHLIARPKGKVIVHYHSDIVRQHRWLKFYGPFQRKFLHMADQIIVTSPPYLETSETLQLFKEKCNVIPFGLSLPQFSPSEEVEKKAAIIRRRYGEKLILFVGILRYYKGLHSLIDAMKEVDGKLLIVGDGPLLPELLEMVKSLPYADRIAFVGQVESVVPYYHAADLFCLPSIFRSEAFGLSLVEAAACGLPLVSTELGTGTSYVNQHNETGLVVPPQNPPALAQALNTILNDVTLRERFGSAAKKRTRENFTQETMGKRVLDLYQQVMV